MTMTDPLLPSFRVIDAAIQHVKEAEDAASKANAELLDAVRLFLSSADQLSPTRVVAGWTKSRETRQDPSIQGIVS